MNELDVYYGENCYWFGIGLVGFLTLGKDTGFVYADTIVQAKDRIRESYPGGVLSIRKAILGETDCSNFTNSGHMPHN